MNRCCCRFLICLLFLSVGIVINANGYPNKVQSLKFIVQETLQQNPEILASIANQYASNEAIKEALAGFMPRAGVRYTTGYENTNTYYLGGNITLHRTEATGYIAQPIFSGFSSVNLVRQRKAELKFSEANKNHIKNIVALRAIQAYSDILRLQKIHVLVIKNIATHKFILAKVREKFRGGAGNKPDIDLAVARLAQRETTLSSVLEAQQNVNAHFIKIVGFAPQILQQPSIPPTPTTLTQSVSTALINNPKLKAAKKNYAAANAAVAVSKSKLLPTVDIAIDSGDYRNFGGAKGHIRDAYALLVVDYNIFNGGGDLANIEKNSYYKTAALKDLEDTRREVVQTVTSSWAQLVADKQQLINVRQHLQSSQAVLAGYKEQFVLGRRTLLDVLNMENEVFNTAVDLENTKYALITDSYSLLTSIGIVTNDF